jgi:cobaltochelatase CobS
MSLIKSLTRQQYPKTAHLIPRRRSYLYNENPHFEQILHGVKQGESQLIVGEPGCGKSEIVLFIASIVNAPVVQIQGDGDMDVLSVIGSMTYSEKAGGVTWVDGVLPYAIRNRCWILLDEINMVAPEVLARLHSMLDDRRQLDLKENNEVLRLTPETVVFATMNPSDDGRHHGTRPLSPALKSRFAAVYRFDYLSPNEEAKVLNDRTGIQPKEAFLLAKMAVDFRRAFKNNEVLSPVDTRMMISFASRAVYFTLADAFQTTVLNRFDPDSAGVLRGIFRAHVPDEAAAKKAS